MSSFDILEKYFQVQKRMYFFKSGLLSTLHLESCCCPLPWRVARRWLSVFGEPFWQREMGTKTRHCSAATGHRHGNSQSNRKASESRWVICMERKVHLTEK